MLTYQNLLVDKPEDGILVVTVNRPKSLNALNPATMRELADMTKKSAPWTISTWLSLPAQETVLSSPVPTST